MTREQQELVENNLGLAHYMAHRYRQSSIEFDELISLSYLGLVKAALHYDPNKEIRFSAFAGTVMTNEILQQLRRDRKHNKVVASLDEETVPGEDMTLGEIIPDPHDHYESVLFMIDMKKNEELLEKNEVRVLRAKIIETDLSQREIARELDMSQSYVSRVMAGMREKILEA